MAETPIAIVIPGRSGSEATRADHGMTRLGRLQSIPSVCADFTEMIKALIFGTGIAVGGALKN
ncbi:hypothetical protein LB515_12925 [Mesorhizobium sp. CA15]|uniref:hypothetical protein n=1 Tax=unclassified Mesorhizobium TaxID=325217 RepID=UPI000BAEAEDF|nr:MULTISPECIES: hypothetical protein [unclassified Mesorhizobium]MBZ9866285.1 hypothetical protein [Mesorhizobium sp. CA15]PBB20666.1 hypothetical protein CK219_05920 [Mesorhizobium sp. WSM4313]